MKINANGIDIQYELAGKEDAPTVMMSHSLGCSFAMWDPQMTALASHFRVLRYDTRGHGGSGAPEGAYTFDQLGSDAVGLLDALGIEKVHWVGLSMGGMIGQNLALNHASRLMSLALCDTSSAVPAEAQPVWDERIARARKEGVGVMVKQTLERWFTPSFISRKDPRIDLIRNQFVATPVAGYIGCCEAIRGLNYLERLSEIHLPTLILVGKEDQGTPVEAAKAMQERIPGARLTVIPSAAHLSNVEQSEAFNKALLDFLRAL